MLGDSHRYERRQKISAPDGWTGERLPCGTLTRLVERLRWLAGLGALPPVPRCRCSKWNTWQAAPDIRGGIGTRLPRTRTVFHVEQWIWPGAEGLSLPWPVSGGPGVRSGRTYLNVFHVEHCTSVLPRENASRGCSQRVVFHVEQHDCGTGRCRARRCAGCLQRLLDSGDPRGIASNMRARERTWMTAGQLLRAGFVWAARPEPSTPQPTLQPRSRRCCFTGAAIARSC